MSEKYLSELTAKLWALYKKERNLSVFQGLLYFLTLWAVLLLAGFLFSLLLVSTGWARPLFFFGLTGTAAVIGRYLFWPAVKKPSVNHLAKKAESGYPELEDRLISAFELAPYVQNPKGFSPQLVEAVIGEAYQKAAGKDFSRLADRRPLRKAVRLTLLSIALTAFLPLLSWPVFKLTVTALANPFAPIEEVLPYRLFAKPEGGKAAKMKDFEVKLAAVGQNLPKQATLHYRYEGGRWHSVSLALEKRNLTLNPAAADTSRTSYVFKELRRDIDFYFSTRRTKTEIFRLEVVDVPYLTHLRARIKSPAYTGLPAREGSDNDGNVAALTGSQVTLSFESQKPLKEAKIIFDDGKTVPAPVTGRKGSAEFAVSRPGRYHVEVTDADGNANVDAIEYEIRPMPDEFPQVEITRPAADLDLTERMFETLGIEAQDDFGFSSLKLKFTITSEQTRERSKEIDLSLTGTAKNGLVLAYGWDLSNLRLNPGDVVSYFVEAADNDAVSGPKKSQSKTYRFRLPSLDEMIAEAAHGTEQNLGAMEEAAREQKQLLEKFKQKSRELLQSGKLDWETKKQLQELAARQEQIERGLSRMQESFEQNLQKMQENDLLNKELAEKMQELAELWDQVASPELKEKMKKLQEALEKLDPEMLQRAMEELNLSQEELLKNMERSIELLKRMAQEQKADALLKQAEKLVEDQKNINREAKEEANKPASELAKMEQKLSEDLDKLQKAAEELQEEMQANPLFDPASSDQLCKSPSRSGAKEKVEESKQNFQSGKKKAGQKSGEEAQEKLEHMLSEMRQAKEQMDQSEKNQTLAEMKKNLDDLLTLSEEQEELSQAVEELSQVEGANLNEMAQRQKELAEQAQKLSSRIEKLADQTLFIEPNKNAPSSQCLNSMNQAAKSLNNRNPRAALPQQKEAFHQLNQAAKQMLESMKQCQGSQGGSGMSEMMQKMQNLSAKQQGINSQTQKMGNGQKQTLTPEELGAYGRLRAQEHEIQRDLKELARQYRERKNVLGRLDELSKDLDKLVEDMERGPSEGVLQRQAQILNRMLDFERSLQTQREDQRREARRPVKDIFNLSPDGLKADVGRRAAEIEALLQKFLDEPHPPEYQEAVRSYFEALKNRNWTAPQEQK